LVARASAVSHWLDTNLAPPLLRASSFSASTRRQAPLRPALSKLRLPRPRQPGVYIIGNVQKTQRHN
jgi:hypothetical protein